MQVMESWLAETSENQPKEQESRCRECQKFVIFQSIVKSTFVPEGRNFYNFQVSLLEMFLLIQQLIPEFFQSSGEFLLNSQSLPLGCKQDKTKVMDVELPCWATGRTKGD